MPCSADDNACFHARHATELGRSLVHLSHYYRKVTDMSATRIPEKAAADGRRFYSRGYHSDIHRHLIGDDEYFWARSKASADFYFTDEERSGAVFEYGCGIGQGIASLPNAAGWDPSEEAREHASRRNVRVYDTLEAAPLKRWDIVFCRHVLSMSRSPWQRFARCGH